MSEDHTLEISLWRWLRLVWCLRQSGKGKGESGAFLLGRRQGSLASVTDFIPYDDIDPHSLDTGIIQLEGESLGSLWDICSERGVEVLADVHTHPRGSRQSLSDQENPMIATRGHVALIIPNFARSAIDLKGVGHYRYRGSKKWERLTSPRLHFFWIRFGR